MAVHDYRIPGWGHACHIRRTVRTVADAPDWIPDGAPIFSGHCFAGRMRLEDEILLPMESGRVAVYVVTAVRTPVDPGDQHFIEAVPVRYLDGRP